MKYIIIEIEESEYGARVDLFSDRFFVSSG